MGKFKVSFTTALFVFSFLVCVIVAVVFVDGAPRAEEDFYSTDIPKETAGTPVDDAWPADSAKGAGKWSGRAEAAKVSDVPPSAVPEPSPAQAAYADLPLDPQLAGAARPIETYTPAAGGPSQILEPVVNPFQGVDPDTVARRVLGQTAISATPNIPGMAIPGGISTPKVPRVPTGMGPAANRAAAPTPLPILTNANPSLGSVSGVSPQNGVKLGGVSYPTQGMQPNSLENIAAIEGAAAQQANTNAGAGWSPTVAGTGPAGAGPPAYDPAARPSMMISSGKTEPNATPPPGFSTEALPAATSLGGSSPTPPSGPGAGTQPLLFAPPDASSGGAVPSNKWDLPPVPTLPGPPVRDPSRDRSDAGTSGAQTQPPDPSSASKPLDTGLALNFSGNVPPELSKLQRAAEEKAKAAQVNDKVLTGEQALKRALVYARMTGKKLNEDTQRLETRLATEEWTAITAVAAEAKRAGTQVSPDEIAKYAEMRPGFSIADYKAAMKAEGFDDQQIESDLRDIALNEKFVDDAINKQYDEAEIRKIYDKSPDTYIPARRLRVQEIFKAKPADEKAAAAVVEEMKRLQRQAAGGTDFSLLASQASEAATKAKGGDLGWLDDESAISDSMARALLPLKSGQVSPVVDDPDGYRLYKLVELREPTKGYEAGRQQVVDTLKSAMRQGSLATAQKNNKVEVTHLKNVKKATNRDSSKDDASKPRQQAAGSRARQQRETESPTVQGQGNSPGEASLPINPPGQAPVAAAAAVPGFGVPPADNTAAAAGQAQLPVQESQNQQSRNPIKNFFGRFSKPSPN